MSFNFFGFRVCPRNILARKTTADNVDFSGICKCSAVEGAVYGAGRSVTEEALGDPELNAEKVLFQEIEEESIEYIASPSKVLN